ncbi:MAG: hypothetical protein HYV19_09705 [Gemmatimonadetes bacterium]|nr:hypothetical protein [Gemmatimonadota bacterium]
MTRLRAALFALILAAAPAAAQVGYEPAKSPYSDLPWSQSVAFFAGGFNTETDPARVGPQPGWLAGVRYDLRIGGPVALVGRITTGPTTHRVIAPLNPIASRVVGSKDSQLLAADLGIALNLTGQKSWHHVVPVLSSGVGVVTDFNGDPDAGGYRFGTRFMFTTGVGLRYHTQGRWEPRVDFTNYLWQIQYPTEYRSQPSDGSDPVLSRKQAPWLGNHLWSLGLSYHLFR